MLKNDFFGRKVSRLNVPFLKSIGRSGVERLSVQRVSVEMRGPATGLSNRPDR